MGAAEQRASATARASHRLVLAVTDSMTARYLLAGQARFLAEEGFDVVVVASPGPDLEEFQRRESVPVAPVPMSRRVAPLSDLVSLIRLTRVLLRLRPDLLNAGTPKAGLLATLAGRLANVPRCVYTMRGLPLETATGAKRRVLVWAERTATRLAHGVICVGPSLRERALALRLTKAEKTDVIANGSSNGVDVERFAPTPDRLREATEIKRRFGLPSGAPVIGFAGRLTRDKGVEDLAQAFFGSVVGRLPEARLLLVGDYEEGDPVAAATQARLAEDPRVIIVGWVPDIAPYYAAMDLLAFPSYREGFPNAPLEAAAAGLPTIGYRSVGTVDAVEHGITGALVMNGDIEALGTALVDYLRDRKLRRRHGEAAAERAQRLFHREIVWRGWARFYRQLLQVQK